MAAELVADGRTELTVLIPRREYTRRWHRMLHDRSSNPIAAAMSTLPHCSVTIVPYHLGMGREAAPVDVGSPAADSDANARSSSSFASHHFDVGKLPSDRTPIRGLSDRDRATVAGRVKSLRVQPWSGTPSLECTLADETGSITVVFFGRRAVGGVRVGTLMSVTGMAGRHHGMMAMLNPAYTIISSPPKTEAPGEHH
jgi:hypothetical protein